MMYTPTPSARRPKPPGSINRRGPAGDTPLSLASAQQVAHTLMTADESDRENAYRHSHISPGPSAVESIASEPPSSGYARHRHDIARSALARITASPSEAGDVSVALDFKESSPTSAVGLGLSSSAIIRPAVSLEATAQPSPPPPYGQGLRPATPDNGEHHTPPQPDSGAHSRCGSLSLSHFPPDLDIDTEQPAMAEEKLRAQRAKEAARAIGLDFGAGRTQSEVTLSSSSEEAEISDEEDMKARLRAARRELKARNNELLMAAQVADRVLRHHEQVISSLPPQIKAALPQLVDFVTFGNRNPPHSPASSRTRETTANTVLTSSPVHRHRLTEDDSSHSRVGRRANASSPPSSAHASSAQTYSHGRYSPPSIAGPSSGKLNRSHSSSISPPSSEQTSRVTRQIPAVPQSSSSARRSRLSVLQRQETDERLSSLEQALHDAQESEEAQRKLAARLKRDFEKLQREFEKAEERMASTQLETVQYSTSRHGKGKDIWRNRNNPHDQDQREAAMRAQRRTHREVQASEEDDEERVEAAIDRKPSNMYDEHGWGTATYPEYPAMAGPSNWRHARPPSSGRDDEEMGEVVARLSKMSVGSFSFSKRGGSTRTAITPQSAMPTHGAPTRSSSAQRSYGLPGGAPYSQAVSQQTSDDGTPFRASILKATSGSRQPAQRLSLPEVKRSRKQLSSSSFLSPSNVDPTQTNPKTRSPLTPRVTIEAPRDVPGDTSSRQSHRSSRSSVGMRSRKTPYPSPQPQPASKVSPNLTPLSGRFGSLSPSPSAALNSISSKMNSMRMYVSNSLTLSGLGLGKGRTLGSELGSEFGDDWDRDMRSLDDVQVELERRSSSESERAGREAGSGDESDQLSGDEAEDQLDLDQAYRHPINYQHAESDWQSSDDPEYDHEHDQSQPPHPLPPRVSAALSSLAVALAPASIFSSADSSVPILPRGSLREDGLDPSAYDLLAEAVKLRKIRWVDADTDADTDADDARNATKAAPGTSTLGSRVSAFALMEKKNWSAPDPWNESDYPDELSDSSTGIRPSRSFSKASGHFHANASAARYGHLRPLALPLAQAIRSRGDYGVSRPGMHARTSSDGTVALAHRRISSSSGNGNARGNAQQGPGQGQGHALAANQVSASTRGDKGLAAAAGEAEDDNQDEGPATIPARIVNDMIILLSILADWLEVMVVIGYRVVMETRYGQRPTIGMRKRGHRKRYYI